MHDDTHSFWQYNFWHYQRIPSFLKSVHRLISKIQYDVQNWIDQIRLFVFVAISMAAIAIVSHTFFVDNHIRILVPRIPIPVYLGYSYAWPCLRYHKDRSPIHTEPHQICAACIIVPHSFLVDTQSKELASERRSFRRLRAFAQFNSNTKINTN